MNKPFTQEQIKSMPKGVWLNDFPNRKKRREPLQKDRSTNKCRLLIYGSGKVKERMQVIDLHASKNPILHQSKVRFKRIKHFD